MESWNSSLQRYEGEEEIWYRNKYSCKHPWPVRACEGKKFKSRENEALSLINGKKKRKVELVLQGSHPCCHMEYTCPLSNERWVSERWSVVTSFGGSWWALNNWQKFAHSVTRQLFQPVQGARDYREVGGRLHRTRAADEEVVR